MKLLHKLIVISTGMVCLNIGDIQAQQFSDFARIFSQSDVHGTARIQGVGGAQTALGGDLSSISGNPAGLGFYTKSEVSVSPGIVFTDNNSSYLGTTTNDFKNQFNFANGGVVINKSLGAETASGFKGGSFGISVTRMNNFQNQLNYQGSNTLEDFIDFAVDEANAQGTNAYDDPDLLPELSFLAFQTTLIDRFFEVNAPGDTTFFFDRNIYDILDPDIVAFPSTEFPTAQREFINTKGAQYQTTIAYGGNFSDKFYLGASVGITSLRFEQDRIFTEEPSESDLTRLSLVDNRLLTGTGINGTIGFIYRPINTFTMGVSYTTPTFYELEDESVITLNADFDNASLDEQVVFVPLLFNLRTPGKLSGGVAVFLEKYGFITADVEWVDYGSGKFSSNEFSFADANSEINAFESTLNFKVGAEFRYNIARFRAGYAHQGDPMNKIDGVDRSRQSITVGAGVRYKRFFADGSYVRSNFDQSTSPYPGAATALTENVTENVVLTFGMKF